MPVIANPFALGRAVDLSDQINVIPNQWGVIQRMGLFRTKMQSQKTIMVPRWTEGDNLLVDRNWDERNSNIVGGKREYLPLAIPHYPVDDSITPNDVDGAIDFSQVVAGGDSLRNVAEVRVEKMERIRRAHATTLEFARSRLLANGSVYAPNGTVTTNFYTEFGITRQVIDMGLLSTVTSPQAAVEGVISAIQDGIRNGDVITDIVALCSPTFFAALISNQFVYESYQYFNQPQGQAILNQRLGSGQFDGRFRVFEYGGVLFVECRGSVAGTPYVAEGQAYAFPLGTDAFRTFFAPANRFDTINKAAQESYFFEYLNTKQDIIEIMTETNFLNALMRPELVLTLEIGD